MQTSKHGFQILKDNIVADIARKDAQIKLRLRSLRAPTVLRQSSTRHYEAVVTAVLACVTANTMHKSEQGSMSKGMEGTY
jgi:acetolactate synthase regulatory subunit